MRNLRLLVAMAALAMASNAVHAQTDSGPIMIGSSIPMTGGVAAFGWKILFTATH